VEFIYRFFKELNSFSSPLLFTLAISLGVFSGINTLVLINLFVFLVVLIFRIPFSLFLVTAGIFKAVGSFFSFSEIGYFTLNKFKEFFSILYNTPFLRWSDFYYTNVMGSFIIGSLLFLTSLITFYPIFRRYKELVVPYLNSHKVFRFLVSEEKKGIIRISGILALLTLIGIIIGFSFIIDPILKFVIQKTTNVKIISLKTSLLYQTLNIHFRKKDFDNNLSLKFDKNYLVWKKFVVKDFNLTTFTNKSFYKLASNKDTTKSLNTSFNFNVKIPSFKKYLKEYHLKSEKAFRKLQLDLERFNQKKELLKKYKLQVKELQKETLSINLKKVSIKDIPNILNKLNRLNKDITSLEKDIRKDVKELEEYKQIIIQDIKNLKIAIKEDYKYIDSKYEMLKNKEYIKFADSFFKPDIEKYVNLVENLVNKIEENKKEILIDKGEKVIFKDKISFPSFFIEKGRILFKNKEFKIIANLKDVNFVEFKPVLLNATVYSKYFKIAYLNMAYFKELKYHLMAKDVKKDFSIFKNALFNLDLKGKNKKFIAFFKFLDGRFIFKNKILNNIHQFYLKVVYNKQVRIDSNLDNILRKEINTLIDKKIKKEKEAFKKYLSKYNKSINLNYKNVDLKSLKVIIKNYEYKLKNKYKSKAKEKIKEKLKEFIKYF